MSAVPARPIVPLAQVERLREARTILRDEARALEQVADRLDDRFCAAVDLLREATGHVVVTGMGKAGLVGRKIAATLSSTGSPAHFLHPAEGVHGDVGCLRPGDVLLALSHSGETDELLRLIPIVQSLHVPIVALTASESSTLGAQATLTVPLGRLVETGPHRLAPSVSTTAMLAVGDALALVLAGAKDFTPQRFAVFHPAGALGRRLSTVRQTMRCGPELRIASADATIRQVFTGLGRPGRRTGAVMLVDAEGCLAGLFTDSDLARLLEKGRDGQIDRPIREAMTADPLTISPDSLLSEALDLLSARKISELPVVDAARRPVGLIDITDVVALLPQEGPE